jgi:hypothetical protein
MLSTLYMGGLKAAPLRDPRCEKKDPHRPELYAMLSDANYSWKGNCYYRIAVKTKDIRYCASIPDAPLDGSCVKMVAIANKDYKQCFDIRRQGKSPIAQNYERECLITYAYELNAPEVCNIFFKGRPDKQCITSLNYKNSNQNAK